MWALGFIAVVVLLIVSIGAVIGVSLAMDTMKEKYVPHNTGTVAKRNSREFKL